MNDVRNSDLDSESGNGDEVKLENEHNNYVEEIIVAEKPVKMGKKITAVANLLYTKNEESSSIS